jgi:hypothetical protein
MKRAEKNTPLICTSLIELIVKTNRRADSFHLTFDGQDWRAEFVGKDGHPVVACNDEDPRIAIAGAAAACLNKTRKKSGPGITVVPLKPRQPE